MEVISRRYHPERTDYPKPNITGSRALNGSYDLEVTAGGQTHQVNVKPLGLRAQLERVCPSDLVDVLTGVTPVEPEDAREMLAKIGRALRVSAQRKY